MAAIASTLQADFSDFIAEAQKANAAMGEMQREATETSSAVAGTAASLDQVGPAAASGTSSTLKLAKGFSTAETALTAFGVAGVSQISNVGQLAQSAAGAATSFGAMGTAAAVAGTAFAGWNIGRLIAEANDLDNTIARLTSRLLGWGDVAAETAGAQQDIIDRARALGYAGNDLAAATKIVNDALKDQQAQFISSSSLIKTWKADLETARGGVSSLKQEIANGNMTTEQMAAKYQVSAEAVKYLTREVNAEKAARTEAAAAVKAQGAAIDEMNQALLGQEALLDTLTDSQRAGAEAALAAGVSQSTIAKAYGLTAVQVRAVADAMKEAEDAVKAFDAAQKIATAASEAWNAEVVNRSATTTGRLIADVERWRTEQIAALEATEGATQAMYDSIEAIAAEKLAKITVNWTTLNEGSIASYADQAARAEATYQEMLGHSNVYTAGAIENAKRVAAESAAAFELMAASHDAVLTSQLQREAAYNAALTEFRTQADAAQETAAAKQEQALDRAIAYAQTYGTTIADAQIKLGQMGAAGEKAGNDTKAAVEGANQAIGQTIQLAHQSSAALKEQARFYSAMASENMQQATAGTIGWSPWQMGQNFQQTAERLRKQAGWMANFEQAGPGGTPWGNRGMTATTTSLNVNVNNADAQGIANKLVEEMRHAGVRFG
jgi:hypothetical protein